MNTPTRKRFQRPPRCTVIATVDDLLGFTVTQRCARNAGHDGPCWTSAHEPMIDGVETTSTAGVVR